MPHLKYGKKIKKFAREVCFNQNLKNPVKYTSTGTGTGIDTRICDSSNKKYKDQSKMSAMTSRDEFNGDFSTIEEMDPSVADGFRVIYDREVSANSNHCLSCQSHVFFLFFCWSDNLWRSSTVFFFFCSSISNIRHHLSPLSPYTVPSHPCPHP